MFKAGLTQDRVASRLHRIVSHVVYGLNLPCGLKPNYVVHENYSAAIHGKCCGLEHVIGCPIIDSALLSAVSGSGWFHGRSALFSAFGAGGLGSLLARLG